LCEYLKDISENGYLTYLRFRKLFEEKPIPFALAWKVPEFLVEKRAPELPLVFNFLNRNINRNCPQDGDWCIYP